MRIQVHAWMHTTLHCTVSDVHAYHTIYTISYDTIYTIPCHAIYTIVWFVYMGFTYIIIHKDQFVSYIRSSLGLPSVAWVSACMIGFDTHNHVKSSWACCVGTIIDFKREGF